MLLLLLPLRHWQTQQVLSSRISSQKTMSESFRMRIGTFHYFVSHTFFLFTNRRKEEEICFQSSCDNLSSTINGHRLKRTQQISFSQTGQQPDRLATQNQLGASYFLTRRNTENRMGRRKRLSVCMLKKNLFSLSCSFCVCVC